MAIVGEKERFLRSLSETQREEKLLGHGSMGLLGLILDPLVKRLFYLANYLKMSHTFSYLFVLSLNIKFKSSRYKVQAIIHYLNFIRGLDKQLSDSFRKGPAIVVHLS